MLSTKKLDPAVLEHISRVCQFSIEEIEDVYPCTPLQEAVIAHPSENAYNHCIIISLSPTLEPDRLCSALHQVVRENSILRTRIVECGIDILQVVTSASPDIRVSTDTLEDVLAQEKAALMTLGTPLMRMVIASGRLILTLHHALGDGWAVHAFLDDVSSVYHGRPSQSHASFKLFVEYLQSFEKTKSIAFWANRFTGTPAVFPSVSPGYYADASAKIGHQIHFSAYDMDISIGLIPSYLETAWALTSKVYSGSGNVAFGLVLSGRTPALGPVQSTLGPTIATVPVQVDVDMQSTIRQMIKTRLHTRRELTNSPALQYGLQNIRSISDAAQLASNFSTLLSISSPVGEDLTYLEDMKQEYEYDRHGPYCIGLVCVVNDQGVSVDAAFDPKVICERQMRRVLAQLEHTFLLLVRSPPDTPLSQLELISNSDKMEQLQWNAISPQSNKEACLHTQFAALARKQPTETAIVSHDGTMTYEQLDTASNSLAQELRRKGLGGEKSAALIFEKSQWAIVAQLAVWKAAGVCVPIDPSYPLAQKQTILSSCKAVILLTSTMHLKEAHSLEENVICVNRHLLLGLPPAVPSSIQDHGTSPSQIAYLLYTSGSTGQSKGVLLEHGNLATSLRAFGDRIGWKPTLRVLQFAAYVWGASIIEIFGVLLFGGCVCVPSDETRLAGVEEFIVDNNVQSAILTPTMIRMISPDDVCGTLESLISAGEPLDIHSLDAWAKRLRYYNGWGQSETAVCSTIGEVTSKSPYPQSIGFPVGCCIWIVNPDNIQELLPIGAVGEIVVEGAGVARGYLNDGLRTAASFIVPPSWTPLSRQRSQEEALSRRMYRTGDLGKRNPDGSICHMGRKDSQVKLHGQKLDLLEIEAVLCSSTAAKACAFLRVSDEGKADLVAVFTVESLEVPTPTPLKRVFPNLNPAIDRDVAKIRDGVFSRLPSYMIPTIWIVVEELAVTTTSKLDRRAIQNWVDDLDLSTAKIDIWARGETLSQPASPIELVLQSTWSIVLSVPALEIGRQSSFIRSGGDSISAMKVVTKCKQRGVQTSVATLLRSKDLATTAMASQLLSTRSHGALADYPVHELRPSTIPMSPYQSLSLDTQFTGSPFEKHYHSFSLRIKPGVPAVTVERALQRLALHHEVLRVRFLQTPDGMWSQQVAPESDLPSLLVIDTSISNSQSRAQTTPQLAPSFKSNPSLTANLFVSSSGSVLRLAAHPLVIDRLSWEVIYKDLLTLLENTDHTLSSSGSYFADWLHMQEKLPPVDNIYTKQHPTGVADYWHMPRSIQSKHTVVRSSITFDEEATSRLMGSCNQSMNTTPIELIQAAVIRSFRQIFIKQGPPSLLIHSDGRQFANNVTDASRAVGCFTTLLPIATDIQSDTPLQDAISMAKDAHREILEKVSEGFMTGKSVLGALQLSDVEIVLRFDAHESSPGYLYERPEMSSELAILGVVDVLAHCAGKTLVLEVSYRRGVAHQDLLELWTLELEKVLIEVASHIPHIKPTLTKSDMALLNLMGDASSEIHQHLSSIGIASTDVGLIMPCPPVQEGMLLAQLRGTGVEYWNRITTRLTPGPSQEKNVDMKRLRKAWEAVCAANPILRTIFTSLPCVAGSSFQQVILKKPAVLISERLAEPEEDIKSSLANMPFAQFAPSQPPHHFHLTQVSPSLVYGTLDISHALMDDRSMRLILQQISQAYRDSTSIIESPDMSAYVRYVQRHRDSDLAYWLEYLCGARPCLIPTIDAGIEFLKHDAAASGDQEDGAMIYDAKALHSFCRAQGITMANLMSTAWAAVLQQVCGGQEVIFGCIQSQHTSQGIDERTLGPLLTMNVCRVHLDPAIRLSSILEQAKEDSLRALDHVGCPLGEIHESIGLNCQSMLFNTTMTVVGTWSDGNMGNDVLQVELLPEVDNATEYPLAVGVIYDNMKVETRLWYDRSKLSRSFIASVKNLLQAAVSTITDNHEQNTASFLKSLRRPLSMLSVEDIAEDVKQDITGQCKIDSASIEDVYPCSRSQEETVNIGSKVGYGGLDQHVYRIDVDAVAHLRRAWFSVREVTPSLRTRIVSLNGYGIFYITLKTESDICHQETLLSRYLACDRGIPVRSGSLLSRFGIVQEPGGYSYMVLSLHPATYDLLMLRGIVSALTRACQGSQPLLMGEFNISSSALLRHRLMNEAMIDTQGSWDSLLKDYKDCVLFPNVVLSHPMAELSEEMLIDLDMPVSGYDGAMADVLCAAWALCLSRRTGEDKVFFGYAPDSGDLLNKEQMFFAGQPVGGIMPCGIDLAISRTRGRLLESVQHYTSKFAAFVGQGTTATSSVTNALVIHSVDTPSSHVEQKAQRPVLSRFHSPPLASIRLLTRCMIGPGSTAAIAMQYDKQVIPPDDVAILMEQYRHAIAQLLLPTSVELRELDILGPHERSVLSSWNFDGPIAVNSCIHDQFREASKQRPTAQALCTTEMEFTYAQVNDLSDRAAAFLQARGVVVGTIVPFFLEKSALAVVVMLAILKAGGVMLALDVKHPAERIAKILTETRAKLVITSPSLMGQISISLDTVPLDMSILQKIDPASLRSVHVTPSDGCYIIYTSGSTGNPKGILCTHTNLATSISSQRESIGIDESARVFQFSNFIFDIIMYDIFMTLTSGGCICMPTPHQWANDVEGAIQAMRSNVVGMTPSSSVILSPVNVPTLRTLFVGGEPVPRETAQKWSHIRLINLYGPSETTVTTSTCQVSLESATSHLSIGRSSNGCNYWVVDRVNHDRLVALGCPGELLVQGPLVARGYIRNPELTKTVFIEPPSWVRDFENSVPHLSEQGGWYKTGDIVVQNADGSLTYKGRKDNQVKLRGQRIEMGEIEFHLKRHANHAWEDIAVEVIQPGGQKQDPTLVVFFTSGTGGNARLPTTQHPPPAAEGSELLLLPMPQEAHEVRSALAADMPEYMLPRFFIHLSRIPSTSTGKMDRKALRGIGLSLSHDQLGLYGCMGGGSTSLQRDSSAGPPRSITPSVPADAGSLSPGAFALRKCWAEILDLATESVTLSDNFFHKGGNSIRAMRLVAVVRKSGWGLTVAVVFKSPTFSAMASKLQPLSAAGPIHATDAAAETVGSCQTATAASGPIQIQLANRHTKLTRDDIESITKATDFQAYMLAVGELDGRGFHNQVALKFEAGVDETRLLRACETLVGHHAILRTMFVQSKCQLYQIVLKSRLLDNGVTTGDERQHEKQRAAARHGEVWPRFHLEQQSEDQCPQLRISIHHALYDAISLSILVQDLGAIYAGQSIPESPSFAQWVSYVDALDSSEAQRFWLQLLEGSSTTQLVPSSSSLPGPSMVSPLHDKVTVRVPMRALTSDEAATPAQVLQAVWAIVLSWFSDDSRDVVFANTSANRHVDFPGADRVAGPCLNLLPVRVLVEPHATLRSIIQRVQAQAIEAMPYHHVSFRSLVQQSTAWLPGTRFSSIVTYQNHESFQDAMRFGDGTVTYRLSGQGDVGDSTDVWVEATTAPETSDRQEETLVVDFLYSQLKISEARVQLMSDYLREILVSMPTISDKPVLQIYQYLKDGGLCAPARISDGAAANADATRGGRIEEDVSDDASDITAGNDQWMTVVLHAWRDVLPRAGQDGGRAGADLVTLMLLSYWYRDHGYDIQVRDLLDRRTPRGQAKLLQALSKG
ncbi:Nonribosomal peptide synthase atnA [Apiospora arundinis]|uniref:Nonribosomal peptide synthase atnA n=1 Tax=Apiospora arundinis TaxID=335852 RepID=A0ABR2HPL2_9PEZI